MDLIHSTNFWNCTLAAAAMVTGKSLEELIELIGHDGSEIIHPELNPPGNRKGFHMQEIIDACLELGWAIVPIEAIPAQTATGVDCYTLESKRFKNHEDRFLHHLLGSKGILLGATKGYWHAVAWNGKKIFDPRGKKYTLSEAKGIDFKIYYRFIKF